VPYPNTELVLVMVIAPMLLNAVYFWACDNFIKKRATLPQGREVLL
jgi:hypothetical protein